MMMSKVLDSWTRKLKSDGVMGRGANRRRTNGLLGVFELSRKDLSKGSSNRVSERLGMFERYG